MKKDTKQIELRKKLYQFLRTKYENTPGDYTIYLKKPIDVPVGTSFTHQSNSGNFTMTCFEEGTQIIGVNPPMNDAIFSKKLTQTKRKKPIELFTSRQGEDRYFKDDKFNLSAMPLEILEAIAKEFGVE
jgi:hypothetical protein